MDTIDILCREYNRRLFQRISEINDLNSQDTESDSQDTQSDVDSQDTESDSQEIALVESYTSETLRGCTCSSVNAEVRPESDINTKPVNIEFNAYKRSRYTTDQSHKFIRRCRI